MDDVIRDYISQCEEVLESKDLQKADKLINKIVGMFESQIINIDQGLDSYTSYLGNHQIDYLGDVTILRDKLTLYLAQGKKKEQKIKNKSGIVVHNANADSNSKTVNLPALFQNTRNKVENDESLSEREIKEILEKIDEIEEISKSKDPKNKKWFKLRPTMEWLGTKGLSVAINILNLITAILAA